MKYKQLITLSILIFCMPLAANAGWFGPKDYDECILESMKGVTSDKAAILIMRSCRKKFPEKPKDKPKTRTLSYGELSNLTGRAGHSFGNYFSGNIYNGNTNVTVSSISISVTTKIGGNEVTRTYTDDVNIASQTTADFGFNIVTGDKDAEYSWSINSAQGY